jgi:hypothetical protein
VPVVRIRNVRRLSAWVHYVAWPPERSLRTLPPARRHYEAVLRPGVFRARTLSGWVTECARQMTTSAYAGKVCGGWQYSWQIRTPHHTMSGAVRFKQHEDFLAMPAGMTEFGCKPYPIGGRDAGNRLSGALSRV